MLFPKLDWKTFFGVTVQLNFASGHVNNCELIKHININLIQYSMV